MRENVGLHNLKLLQLPRWKGRGAYYICTRLITNDSKRVTMKLTSVVSCLTAVAAGRRRRPPRSPSPMRRICRRFAPVMRASSTRCCAHWPYPKARLQRS